MFLLMMFALHLSQDFAWSQKQRRTPTPERGLKVTKQPAEDQPQQQQDQETPAPVSDKPQLVVKLGHYTLWG